MVTELTWAEGQPSVAGLYFVARELGPLAGTYEMASWDGRAWNCDFPEEIIAFVEFEDFKRQLNVKWPKPEPEVPRHLSAGVADEDWVEV